MVSSTSVATYPRRLTASPPPMILALEEVAVSEPGIIINDHYSYEEYVKKRAHFLNRHLQYRHLITGMFPIVRNDAGVVFSSEYETLSVQEVRRREVDREVTPLLPLPTDKNMQSIDSHRSYPPREWEPGMTWSPIQVTNGLSSNDRLDISTSSSPQAIPTSTLRNTPTTISDQVSPQQPSLDRAGAKIQSETQSASPDVLLPSLSPDSQSRRQARSNSQPHGTPAMTQTQCSQQPNDATMDQAGITKSNATIAQATESDAPVDGSSQNFASSIAYLPSRQAQADYSSQHRVNETDFVQMIDEGASPENPQPPGDILATQGSQQQIPSTTVNIGNSKAHKGPPSQTFDSVQVDSRVSALSGRPLHVPVKQKRGSKRAASLVLSETTPALKCDDGTEQEQNLPHLPRKKAKLNVASMRPNAVATPPKMLSPPTPPKETRTQFQSDLLDAIVAGITLPRTPARARQASDARRQRLVAHRRGAKKASAKTAPLTDADTLPEFFSSAGFPADSTTNDAVRCLCGATADDGANMAACDLCGVWQHTLCVGQAAPRDPADGGPDDYRCHVCDPWRHRRLIAGLRRANPLE